MRRELVEQIQQLMCPERILRFERFEREEEADDTVTSLQQLIDRAL